MQQYAAAGANDERTCQACGRKAKTLLKCARCTFFWYCDKVCEPGLRELGVINLLIWRAIDVPDSGLEGEGPSGGLQAAQGSGLAWTVSNAGKRLHGGISVFHGVIRSYSWGGEGGMG